jgi:tRNA nucleotidyltransferase (CCA-adding enzyme)
MTIPVARMNAPELQASIASRAPAFVMMLNPARSAFTPKIALQSTSPSRVTGRARPRGAVPTARVKTQPATPPPAPPAAAATTTTAPVPHPPVAPAARKVARDLDVCLCHATADFDTLAAAVGLARLRGPGTKIVIPAGEHEAVQRYLSLHRGLFPIVDAKAVDPDRLRWVGVVDTHARKRLGPAAAAFLDHPDVVVEVVDHHPGAAERCDIPGARMHIEPVGAASTIIVEMLQAREQDITITPAEATLLALAIHTDTGNLCWETTTTRDASALAWCLSQGACQRSIAQFARNYLTPEQQRLLSLAIDSMTVETVDGIAVASVVLEWDSYVKGMAGVAQATMELSNADVLILAMMTPVGRKTRRPSSTTDAQRKQSSDGIQLATTECSSSSGEMCSPTKQVSLIGRARSRVEGVDFSTLFAPLGGGGHAKAASASFKVTEAVEVQSTVDALVRSVIDDLPEPVLVKDFMSRTVACLSEQDTMEAARDMLFSLGHTGLPVVASVSDPNPQLVGVVSRQDVAMAERRDLLNTPVKGWVARKPICATEDTPLHEAEAMLADNKIGRLPVVRDGRVVGIVTRSDILIQRRLLSR